MQHPIDKELLKKYLKDTCTPSELELVRGYLGNPASQAILQELIAEESAGKVGLPITSSNSARAASRLSLSLRLRSETSAMSR